MDTKYLGYMITHLRADNGLSLMVNNPVRKAEVFSVSVIKCASYIHGLY
jgi:hypothetical protein